MKKIAFDIDDTIWKVDVKHNRQIPDYDLIQVLKWFYNNGDEIYVWSGGGVDYAQQIVDKLGLTDMVKVIPKVKLGDKSNPNKIDIAFDDAETGLANVDVRVNREHHIKDDDINDLKKCPRCGVKFIPDTDDLNEWDGHTFKPNCQCLINGIRISIG